MSSTKVTVILRGKPLSLDDNMLLGQGGEARVFRHPTLPDLALKVFHDVDAADPVARKLAKLRADKLSHLTVLARPLPSAVVAPVDTLTDKRGDVVGYAMPLVPHASDIALLAKKSARAGAGFSDQGAVLAIFVRLLAVVDAVHAAGVVVGDLNDGNVLIASGTAPFLIDADSMQLGGLPCPVAHERFLDPRLYGRSLVDQPCFDVESDHYALRVLLFQSLLCVHPYGGVHPKLPTLLRRAEASHSVLRGDVQLPRAAFPVETLSDDMLHDFALAFDQRARTPLPLSLLERVRFVACSCGIEHARASCPVCKIAVALAGSAAAAAPATTAPAAPPVRTSGGCVEESVVALRGGALVIEARALGGQLAFLVDDGARVYREDHATVFAGKRVPGMRFAIAGGATWVGHGAQLVKVEGERVVDRALTSVDRHGAPVFAAGRGGLFVVEGDALVHHESRRRVGRVFEGQTALFGGADAGGIGMYRAGRKLLAFLFTRDGALVDAHLAQPPGKVVDVSVAFDDETGGALAGFACDDGGARVHVLSLLDARGRLIASAAGAPDSSPILESIGGKLLARGRVLSTSSEGIVSVDVDGARRQLRAGAVFSDTKAFVDASVELLPATGGALYVVAPHAITRLRLSGRRT